MHIHFFNIRFWDRVELQIGEIYLCGKVKYNKSIIKVNMLKLDKNKIKFVKSVMFVEIVLWVADIYKYYVHIYLFISDSSRFPCRCKYSMLRSDNTRHVRTY